MGKTQISISIGEKQTERLKKQAKLKGLLYRNTAGVGDCVSVHVWRNLCTERSAHHITAVQNLQDGHALA